MNPAHFKALCGLLLLLSAPAVAQSGTLHGTVVTQPGARPLEGVRVTATSPALKAEQVGTTDAQGNYRLPRLPPGTYALRFEKESFLPQTRTDVLLKPDATVRINAELSSGGDITVERPVSPGTPQRIFEPLSPFVPPYRAEADGVARVLPPTIPFAGPEDDRERAPAWALPHMPVLVPDGAVQYLYRSADDVPPPEFRTRSSDGVNPTIDTEEDRFSVLFVDVKTASYALARDYLQRDVLPDERTVWAEEFINSFGYGDEGQANGPFIINIEGFPSPSRKGYHVLRVGVKAREALPDVGVQVEFGREAVARYRLVGYERASPAPEPLDDDEEEHDTPMRAGQSITAIYEVKIRGPAIAFGRLHVNYDDPGGSSRRVLMLLPSSVLKSSYARAAPATRLAYVASAFAEKLRGSFWMRTLDWARLHALWEEVGEPLRSRQDVAELGALIRKAQALDKRKDRYERQVPLTNMDLDQAPDAAD
ncbi:YfbK domain-containing protein [Pyxidicoccus xibeiensis]|uniref:YfbK domain-containing protein n=1 Tax=Pyxidicoccus xibeiensis TaxID=2906759 RepID=UPI0020A7AFC6|nr:von Willebrand factor type A domain-containing protein [Pyxidicoccus xibeiensis]MCP3141755.1 von Willebrand factor type A domain-containing protein [Pyxidicoccus xibeiensis]